MLQPLFSSGSWLVASGSWLVGVATWATRRVLGNIIPKLENHSYSEAGLPRASPYRCDASGISFLVVSGSWLVVRRGRHVGDPSGIGQHYPQAGKSLIF